MLPEIPLREYQQQAIDGLRRSLSTGHRKPVLVSPTGSGKTHVACAIVCGATDKGKRVLFLAPRRELIYQASERLQVHGILPGVIMAGEPRSIYQSVQVASFDTLHARGVRTKRMLMPDADVVIVDECFTPDVEILTDQGFVRFDETGEGVVVAQVDQETEEISFVNPEKIICKPYSGEVVTIKSDILVDLTMTPNHELLIDGYGKRKKQSAKEVKFNSKKTMLVAGYSGANDSELTPHEKLMIAYQADGNLHRHCNNGKKIIMFSFSKLRKIKELETLLQHGGYIWGEVKGSAAYGNSKERRRFSVRQLDYVTKDLNRVFDLKKISKIKARKIIDYMVKWDGHLQSENRYYYSSRHKHNTDFYQAVAILAGYKTNQTTQTDERKESYSTMYRLFIQLDKNKIGTQSIKKTTSQYSGMVYCVRVPKGNIIVRRSGKPLVVGNCHLSVAPTRKAILDHYEKAVIIGLTATPARGDGKGLGAIYNDLVESWTMRQLVDAGYLVPARYFAPSKPDLAGLKVNNSGDYVIEQLGERVDRPQLVGDVVHNWQRLASDRRTVVFCVNRSHARHVCEAFKAKGVSAGYLDGDTPLDERKEILARIADGRIQVLVNIFVATFGWDCPAINCVVLARPTRNIALYLQTGGRGLRVHPESGKTDCVARDTEILTDKGLVKIQDVTLDHKVWDGVNYVTHNGSICKGVQAVIEYNGIYATPNHKVMTDEGWKTIKEASERQLRIIKTGFGGEPIRFSDDNLKKNGRYIGQDESTCGVLSMWSRFYGAISQYAEAAKNKILPILQPENSITCAKMALSSCTGAEGSLRKQKLYFIRKVWGERNKVQIQERSRSDDLDKRKYWDSIQGYGARQDRQQRSLRARESSLVHNASEREQQEKIYKKESSKVYKVQKNTSGSNVCRRNTTQVYSERNDFQRNSAEMGGSIIQAEREVWDIHCAGPLQRFTANGLLVHNCLIIDHSGAVDEHGFLDDPIPWSLDENERVKDRKKAQEQERQAPKEITCGECGTVFRASRRCPNCGHEIIPKGKPIPVHQADLHEVERSKKKTNREMSWDEKVKFFGELKQYCADTGKKPGFAAHRYKAKTGVFPNDGRLKTAQPRPVSEETRKWIVSQNIRYAKRRVA